MKTKATRNRLYVTKGNLYLSLLSYQIRIRLGLSICLNLHLISEEGLSLFLEDFLRLPYEEKWTQVESYPFFSPKMRKRERQLEFQNQRIDETLRRLCFLRKVPPSEEYFASQVSLN